MNQKTLKRFQSLNNQGVSSNIVCVAMLQTIFGKDDRVYEAAELIDAFYQTAYIEPLKNELTTYSEEYEPSH